MQNEKLSRDVRKGLARLTKTNPEDWFLVFRARYGMETTLRALASVKGTGEVITQAFTCATAINPILSAGHIPVYIDTSTDDLSLDTSKLQSNTGSRALIMQHSFGIESAMKKARTFASKHGLLLLEDSAHCIGFLSRDADGNPLADVSVHSFGVEKMLPTKFGGAVWVNPAMKDVKLHGTITHALSILPVIKRSTQKKARGYRFINRLLNHTPDFFEGISRSFFITIGVFEPAIMPAELNGKNYDAPARPNNYIAKAMLDGLKNYESLIAKRRAVTSVYLENWPKNLTLPKGIRKEGSAPVRLPLLCENKLEATRLFEVLRNEGHYSGKWYSPTIFPGVTNPEMYNYDPELCPVTEDLSARILNLPTNITTKEAREILDVLHRETN